MSDTTDLLCEFVEMMHGKKIDEGIDALVGALAFAICNIHWRDEEKLAVCNAAKTALTRMVEHSIERDDPSPMELRGELN